MGLFGGIIDTTNIKGILKLDVLRTDYFHSPACRTWLYFNPYNEDKNVFINVGSDPCDLYDAAANNFIKTGVTGETDFAVPHGKAVLLVLTPAGGTVTYVQDRMLVNGIVADYRSGQTVTNYPPRIKAMALQTTPVVIGTGTALYCTAMDRDDDVLSYSWHCNSGGFSGSGSEVTWTAPQTAGQYIVRCIVNDGRGGQDSAAVSIPVVLYINHIPVIDSLEAAPRKLQLGALSRIDCYAHDSDGDSLTVQWSARAGTLTPQGTSAMWQAPGEEGFYYVRCRVTDQRDGVAVDSIGMVVRDTSTVDTGIPIAYYPFNGNANDESGNDHHGVVKGATLTEDRFGMVRSAYSFNGQFDLIQVPNRTSLNFQDGITVSLWLKADAFYDSRESYPISHGSWETRWKISISPDRTIRWTVKSNLGIKDLDSQTPLQKDRWTNITALYDGKNFDLYLNGVLDNHTTFSGKIIPTPYDLTIGQVVPDNPGYNFKGVLDDIRIYNYALSEQEIRNIHGGYSSVDRQEGAIPAATVLYQNYPNPFNSSTSITYQLKKACQVSLRIYNMNGQQVCTLVRGTQPSGGHVVTWDGRNDEGMPVTSGIYICELSGTNFRCLSKLAFVR